MNSKKIRTISDRIFYEIKFRLLQKKKEFENVIINLKEPKHTKNRQQKNLCLKYSKIIFFLKKETSNKIVHYFSPTVEKKKMAHQNPSVDIALFSLLKNLHMYTSWYVQPLICPQSSILLLSPG